MKKIAIIGSGITGCTLAVNLKEYDITIFDKSRGVGGRLATRRANNFVFDHGAPFFQIKTKDFYNFLKPAIKNNYINSWKARFVDINDKNLYSKFNWKYSDKLFIGTPNMNMVGKFFCKNFKLKLSSKIVNIFKLENLWYLEDDTKKKYGPFEWLYLTVPAAQAALICKFSSSLRNKLKKIKMGSCYSLMLGFNKKIDLGFDFAFVKNKLIKSISVNSAKPERDEKNITCMVILTNMNIKEEKTLLKKMFIKKLIKECSNITNLNLSDNDNQALHYWRYSQIINPPLYDSIVNYDLKLAICGDWMVGPYAESGFLSALDAIKKFKVSLKES